MSEKKYEFMGVDAKTELVLGLISVVIASIIFFFINYFFNVNFTSSLRVTVISSSFFFIVFSVVLRLMSLKKRGSWQITHTSQTIEVKYNNKSWTLKKATITEINFVGQSEFRYLTLKSDKQTIKIRVGIGALTPFSKKEDLEIVDLFISDLKPYLISHFTHSWKKMSFFDNEGKYKRK